MDYTTPQQPAVATPLPYPPAGLGAAPPGGPLGPGGLPPQGALGIARPPGPAPTNGAYPPSKPSILSHLIQDFPAMWFMKHLHLM